MKTTQTFDGINFYIDKSTGYFFNSTLVKRMHQYVWEFYNGDIPKGYEIHHIDHDKSNNHIDNLELMTAFEHRAYHGGIRGRLNVENGHLDNIRDLSKEWHGSEEGIEWHKQHYKNHKEKLHEEKEFICVQCDKHYVGVDNGQNRFCSGSCKSKFRRASGVDDTNKECVICGTGFTANKYSKARTCSGSCRAKLGHQDRQGK